MTLVMNSQGSRHQCQWSTTPARWSCWRGACMVKVPLLMRRVGKSSHQKMWTECLLRWFGIRFWKQCSFLTDIFKGVQSTTELVAISTMYIYIYIYISCMKEYNTYCLNMILFWILTIQQFSQLVSKTYHLCLNATILDEFPTQLPSSV